MFPATNEQVTANRWMRIVVVSAILAALLPFPGCDNQKAPPAPQSNSRPGVEVHTPNVDVKANKQGTSVRTPGADIDVQKKQP